MTTEQALRDRLADLNARIDGYQQEIRALERQAASLREQILEAMHQ